MRIKDLFGCTLNEAASVSSFKGRVPRKAEYIIPEWSAETGIPERILWLYAKVGSDQRGKPEEVMMTAQSVMGGGVMAYLLEHVGDLTNRASPLHQIDFARGSVMEKVEKCINVLNSGYGVEREVEENLRSTASFRNQDYGSYKQSVDRVLKTYSMEHRKLLTTTLPPLYQYTIQAAVSLGEMDFDACKTYLNFIRGMCNSRSSFIRALRNYDKQLEQHLRD